jgi:predicted PurR-regulated permease PerM
MNPKNNYKVEISTKTSVITIALIIGVFIAWELRVVFFMFFIAYIISAACRPAVNFLERFRVPRMISTIIIFVLVFSLFGLLIVTIVAEGYNQLNNLFSQLPNIVYNILTSLNKSLPISSIINPEVIKGNLKDVVSVLMKLDLSVFTNGITSAVGFLSGAATLTITVSMISVLSIYLLLRKDDAAAKLLIFFDGKNEEHYTELFKKIEHKLGSWLRAQFVVMFSSGFLVWFGLSLPVLFIPNYGDYNLLNYALPIALLVFVIELLPGFGIAAGSILTVIIALASGNMFLIIFVPLLFMIIQQIESMVIVPRVMKKAIDLDPVITILAVVAGSLLFGVIGVILIIPILAVIKILLVEYMEHKKKSAVN